MRNLYWKSHELTKNLVAKDFDSEAAFENYIFKNQDLLGDVIILYRQIRTGSRQGIPDMLGVDQDANICIIEMKNVQVGEEILPQLLGYAMWGETNPDSIRAIWLESKSKPDNIQIDWDVIQIRVIVIAPSFKPIILRMASKIGYPVDLIQVQRFSFEEEEFVLVETLEELISQKPKITTAKGDWSWEYYEENHGKEPTQEFKKLIETLVVFTKDKKWDLPYNLNKYYTGFKYGNKVVFFVAWSGISSWQLNIKIPKRLAESFEGQKWQYQRYDAQFNYAAFKTKSGKYETPEELESLLVKAYNKVAGKEL